MRFKTIKEVTIKELYDKCPMVAAKKKGMTHCTCAPSCNYYTLCHHMPFHQYYMEAMEKLSTVLIEDNTEDLQIDTELIDGESCEIRGTYTTIIFENVQNIENITVIKGDNNGSN